MYSTLPQLLMEKAKSIGNLPVQYYKDKSGTFNPVTYGEFSQLVLDFEAGLLSMGTKRGDHVGLISDDRREWFVCSMGIMASGACDIPRGSEATAKDLGYILSFVDCRICVAESRFSLAKILENKEQIKTLEKVILIDPTQMETNGAKTDGVEIYSYDEILEIGRKFRKENPDVAENTLNEGTSEETATIIFTSGTTGTPKGVELTHNNFMCQLEGIKSVFPLKEGDKALCVLPVWHVYEREMEYALIYIGCALCYSKPVASLIMADLKKINPQFMACVPRIWDALFKQIQKNVATKTSRLVLFKFFVASASTLRRFRAILHGRNQYFKKRGFFKNIAIKGLYLPIIFLLPLRALGDILFFNKAKTIMGNGFKVGMSGGGGLAPKIDRFFNSTGFRLVEGYGLTETAPICSIRYYKKPVLGTIGRIMPYCEGRIINRHGQECAPGQIGVLYIHGPNVMKGYYKQPELTEKVLKDGWFNTGDLVMRTYKGELMIKGRQKDTIVLHSGENIEPFPLECKLAESPYISQAVVVGQDKNCLGALIIPAKDNILKYAKNNGMNTENSAQVLKSDLIHDLMFKEFERLISPKTGFKPFEKIGKYVFLDKPFEVGSELSAKQDIIRYKINEMYKWQIMMMFSDSVVAQNLGNLSNLTSSLISKIPGKKDKK